MRKWPVVCGLLIAALTAQRETAASSCGLAWQWCNPYPTGKVIMRATYGDGKIVAVGTNGLIMNSTDGITWSERPIPAPANLWAVIWTGQQFVAGGSSGTIISSPDGLDWTLSSTGQRADVQGLAFGNGLYVATGWYQFLISRDLVNWEVVPCPIHTTYDVAYGEGRFVASDDRGNMATSTDGYAWEQVQLPSSFAGFFQRVEWMGKCFLAGGAAEGIILTSQDGLNWTQLAQIQYVTIMDFAFDGKNYLAVGKNYQQSAAVIYRSRDLRIWSSQSLPLDGVWQGGWMTTVTYTGSAFVAMGWSEILRSEEGVCWLRQDTGAADETSALNSVAYGNGMFVAVGTADALFSSENGVEWVKHDEPVHSLGGTSDFSCVAFGNGTFVALGTNGLGAVSTDGVHWVQDMPQPPAPSALMRRIVYHDGIWVAVGNGGAYWSTDTRFWTLSPSCQGYLNAVTFGNGEFLAVGRMSLVFTSTDGINWVRHPSLPTLNPEYADAYWDGTQFLVVVENGHVYSSPDGNSWQDHAPNGLPPYVWFKIRGVPGHYVLLGGISGYGGTASAVSDTLQNWTVALTPHYSIGGYSDAFFDSRQFIAVGASGHVISSCCSLTARPYATPSPRTALTFDFKAEAGCADGQVAATWDFGDGSSAEGAAVSHIYPAPGTYITTLTIWDQRGYGDSDTRTMTLTTPPFVRKIQKLPNLSLSVAGENLQPGIKVKINGQEMPNVKRQSSAKLVIKTPPIMNKKSPGRVQLINPDGGQAVLKWP